MSARLKFTNFIFAITTLILGIPLLIAPGRFLGYFHWAPIDPLLSRLLGATLLGFAWAAFRIWQRADFKEAYLPIQIFTIFTIGGALGFLRHLLKGWWPPMVWMIFALLVVFSLLFSYALYKKN